ncbi:hypothetical protein COCOBI_01-1740 [Coccomyxa sp. Obi]|nr:hypothetical protein COCOBI_01-1740 [Coccomyxa sp. Obi]
MQQYQHTGLGHAGFPHVRLSLLSRSCTSRRELSIPAPRRQCCGRATFTNVHSFRNDVKPAYNKYRSRSDVEKDYIRQWKETTARDGSIKPRTFWSTIIFVPMWFKYEAIPEIVRYAWYIVWSALKVVHYKYHKWAVLQGAKLDLALARKGNVPMQTFSRCLAMRRFHNKVGIRDNVRMRLGLLKGQPEAIRLQQFQTG